MNFAHPTILWGLTALPLLGLFLWWAARRKEGLLARFVQARLIPVLTRGISTRRDQWRALLLLLAIGCWIVALARPQWGYGLEEVSQRGLDMIVAIDTSRSMLADDVSPDRLTRAKLAALDLKELARSDRLGLVAFAGSAFLQCPLSLDDEAFRQSVNTLDVNIIPQGGTAVAEAIQTALSAFKEKSDNHKILVLFTDGEDHEGMALEVARKAGKAGMRVFTVGVGTPAGELLSRADEKGRRSFIKDAEGQVVKSRLNETLLRQIAEATGGFYLPLTGSRTMDTLYERGLAPLPRTDSTARTVRRYHERFVWFIAPGVLLLLLEMFLPHFKPGLPASRRVTLGIVLLLASVASAGASPRAAFKQYQAGRFSEAYREYERLAGKKPDDARLRYNAGTAAYQAGNYDDAARQFSQAVTAEDLALQQRAYYNRGNAQYRLGEEAVDPKARQQQWEGALESYEGALKLNSEDSDARYNRELVSKRLEELKQQQKQESKPDKDDQKKDQKNEDKKDPNDPNKNDKQEQEKDKNGQPKPDEKGDKPDQPSEGSKPEEDKAAKDQPSPDQPKPGDQPTPPQPGQPNKPGDEKGTEGSPATAQAMQMTPQQAARLLDTLRTQEAPMVFTPQVRTNRQNRILKDW